MSLGSLLSMPMKICTEEELEKLKKGSNQYDFYYPIGNCRPLDVTHGCKISTPCDVMLLGCGDVRYFLHTLDELHARLGEKKKKPVLNFHLNDIEDGILCRNLIFLHLLHTIDPENAADLKFLWSVWNEALLHKDHHTRLQTVLNTLQDVQTGDNGVYFGSDWTREKLILDMKWFAKQKIRPQTIIDDRRNFFLQSYNSSEFPNKPTLRVASKFTMQHQMFDDSRLKDRLEAEIQEYVEFGTTRNNTGRRRRRDLERDFYGNQTLYRPRSEEWKSQDNCSPFMCYNVDYELPRFDGVNTTMAALFLEKLQAWVRTYQKVKRDGWDVKIILWLGDCVDLCDVGLPESLQFDFIHTSNLSDRLGIVPLLVHSQGRLKRDDGLVTIESYQWARMNNTVENTLKFSVDIPLPMYPTVVGLHLVDDLCIGHERLLENGMFVGCGSLILTWKVARQPSSIEITGSDDVSKSIKGMVRLNTEQKNVVGPFGFQGAELTKFDIEGRNKLIQRLRGFVSGGGKQISKVISDFLMGSVPGSLKFLTEEEDPVVDTEPCPGEDGQLSIVEFVDRYEVTLTCDPTLMRGQFSCDHRDESKDIVIFMFKEDSKVQLKKTAFFSCNVALSETKIQVARKRGTVSCVVVKHMGFINSEILMPREKVSQTAVTKLQDFPLTSFGRDLLGMYIFRIYPLHDKEPVEEREELEFDEQTQGLTEFLMMTYFKSGKKKKVLGLPTATGKDNILGRWSSIFQIEGLKIWEGKPTLFVTWYHVDLARMLILDRRVTIQDVADVVKTLKPEETFKEFHKYVKAFQAFGSTMEVNSERLKQAGEDQHRWILRTFVRPRYRHLPFETHQSEVNLSKKFGKFPTDPRDAKAHMKKMFAANPMTSHMNLGDKEFEELYKRSMKLLNPGFSGYGAKNQFSNSNAATPPATDTSKQTSGVNSSSSEVNKCDGCGKASPEGKKCSGCKNVIYCDRECQRKAWPRHKLVCKK